ncbi:MAG: hypothetical protein ACD_60C00031G0004 [uncultured bacterium]|nr:MAG: hypothetical protein ACD_60C00031G0004 [uncultured bacterium]
MFILAKALMIISRYLIKELLNSLLAVTFVLLLVFLSQQLVRYLSYAASGKIAANILLQILAFEIPTLLALLLPLGLFLGVLLTYGRLYADNELRVLHACGLSSKHLIRITSLLAFLVMLALMVLMLWLNPSIIANKQQTLASNSSDNLLNTLMPGRFQVSNDGKRVIYVEKISRSHKKASNLFVAEQGNAPSEDSNMPWMVMSADNGYQTVDQTTKQSLVIAEEGYRYEGMPGQKNYKIIQFQKYTVRVPNITLNAQRQIQEAMPTKALLAHYHDDPENASELQWRIAIPLSAFLLAFLAIPLSKVPPRQSRYTMLLPAILIYVVYMNLLFVGRNLIEQKMISDMIGLWWVHLCALAVIISAMLIQRVRGV